MLRSLTATLVVASISLVSSLAFAQSQESKPKPVKALNPDVGANFLGILQRGAAYPDDRTAYPRNGLAFQEAELQFSADVDPYLRGVALFSIGQEDGEFAFEPEEVYGETLSLPSVTLRAGKYKLAVTRHNQLHTHAFPFIDAPLIQQELLGDEGLNEMAVGAAYLVPTPWFSEIVVQGFNPTAETLFTDPLNPNQPASGDWGVVARARNLWDLTDELTLDLGISGVAAENQFDRSTTVFGGDLTFKWRPSEGGKYSALVFSTEYLSGVRRGLTDASSGESIEALGGLAAWVQYQFAQRWWIQGRYERVGMQSSEAIASQDKASALLGFFPSEFSGLRLQYDLLETEGKEKADHAIALQFNFSVGAHPAHTY